MQKDSLTVFATRYSFNTMVAMDQFKLKVLL